MSIQEWLGRFSLKTRIKNYVTKIAIGYAREALGNCLELHNIRRFIDLGLPYLNSRLDLRLARLEILMHYQDAKLVERLEPDAIKMLEYFKNEFFNRDGNGDHLYLPVPYYEPMPNSPNPYELQLSPQGNYFVTSNGVPIFLFESLEASIKYWTLMMREQTPDSPHLYIAENDSAFPPPGVGAVLADVGAAEGFFTAKYIHLISKAYVFECEPVWLERLRQTFAGYERKVEIVEGMVGCREGEIKLDDFFKGKAPPTFIKMDVEGAEGRVLRGMKGLIENTSLPMQMAVCLYHRWEDEAVFTDMLKDYFNISYSKNYYWQMLDHRPPFFRRGVLRALRRA